MKASLFLTTHEMPRHLELVIAALERQTALNRYDYEILICDDGSGEETKKIIDRFKSNSRVPVTHFWQEHQGFRKCKILNQALRKAQGEIAIFLDGDCVPHREYIRAHIENQQTGFYLAGRRLDVGPRLSAEITVDWIKNGFLDFPNMRLWKSCRSGDSKHFQRSFYVPIQFLRPLLGMSKIDDLVGCNYSLPRQALIDINGFDEEYNGYGREDTDVEIRLQNLGLEIKSMKGLALQFHIWHPRREFTPSNDRRLEEAKKLKRIRCEKGLN